MRSTRVVPRELTLVPWGRGFFIVGAMDLTFHLVSSSYFDSLDSRTDYTPNNFVREGFIHCTDDAQEIARVANALYKSNPEPHYYLYIDKTRVRARIR